MSTNNDSTQHVQIAVADRPYTLGTIWSGRRNNGGFCTKIRYR